jgi:hypothetical protein
MINSTRKLWGCKTCNQIKLRHEWWNQNYITLISNIFVRKYSENTQKAINATTNIFGITETWHMGCVRPLSQQCATCPILLHLPLVVRLPEVACFLCLGIHILPLHRHLQLAVRCTQQLQKKTTKQYAGHTGISQHEVINVYSTDTKDILVSPLPFWSSQVWLVMDQTLPRGSLWHF